MTAKLVETESGAGPETAGPVLVGMLLAKREGSLPGSEPAGVADGRAMEPLRDGAGDEAAADAVAASFWACLVSSSASSWVRMPR